MTNWSDIMKMANILCFACSIFKSELEALLKRGTFDIECTYFSSMLHMVPDVLDKKIESVLTEPGMDKRKILLLYGDCCPNMTIYEKQVNVFRTKGINCIEILLGKKMYKKLIKEGAFFLMPEWARRWKEVFQHELKLEGKIAAEFMQEFHSKVIYLDTGHLKIPKKQLTEIQQYSGLPVEIIKIDDSHLENTL